MTVAVTALPSAGHQDPCSPWVIYGSWPQCSPRPLWVIRRHWLVGKPCPLHPRKRTSLDSVVMPPIGDIISPCAGAEVHLQFSNRSGVLRTLIQSLALTLLLICGVFNSCRAPRRQRPLIPQQRTLSGHCPVSLSANNRHSQIQQTKRPTCFQDGACRMSERTWSRNPRPPLSVILGYN
jgi:hypothetical protein